MILHYIIKTAVLIFAVCTCITVQSDEKQHAQKTNMSFVHFYSMRAEKNGHFIQFMSTKIGKVHENTCKIHFAIAISVKDCYNFNIKDVHVNMKRKATEIVHKARKCAD